MVRCSLPLPIKGLDLGHFHTHANPGQALEPQAARGGVAQPFGDHGIKPRGQPPTHDGVSTMRSYFKLCPIFGIFGSDSR